MKNKWQGKLIFLLPVLLLAGCKDKSSQLLKTWKMDDLRYSREIPPAAQATINQSLKEMKENIRMTYYADGTYKTILKDSQLHGTWKLNWNSTKVTAQDDGGQPKEYKIDELSDDKYIFEANDGKENVIFVMVPAK